MKYFTSGEYLGINKNELSLDSLLLSETIYRAGFASDWHRHENAYFAFVLDGGCVEERKKVSVDCVPGKMLFYNCEEQHRNHSYQPGSRIFNIEFSNALLAGIDIYSLAGNGILTINNPDHKFLLLKIFREYRLMDLSSRLNIEAMTISLLSSLKSDERPDAAIPQWAINLREMLHDQWQETFSLTELAVALGVHPVTISRYFPRYFNCTIGEYIRKIRIDRSLHLIRAGNDKLTNIAFACGFADQSHFIRSFKKVTGLVPNDYRAF